MKNFRPRLHGIGSKWDRIQNGSDPLFGERLHEIGSRTVRVYTGSDPFGFYELLAALY